MSELSLENIAMDRAGLIVVLAAGLLMASNQSLRAQGRGGLTGGWGGIVLLLHPEVQQELKLDKTQVERTRALAAEMARKQKDLFSQLEGLVGQERAKKVRDLAEVHLEEGRKVLGTILKPEQFLRFEQIDLQQRGAAALTDPGIARALKLSPQQTGQINRVLDRSILRMREAPSLSRGDREATRVKIELIRKETDSEALGVLLDDQNLSWKAMAGKPFAMSNAPHPGR